MKNTKYRKREYTTPVIEQIQIDNTISLVLESTPPDGPGEVLGAAPEYFNNNPFKSCVS